MAPTIESLGFTALPYQQKVAVLHELIDHILTRPNIESALSKEEIDDLIWRKTYLESEPTGIVISDETGS